MEGDVIMQLYLNGKKCSWNQIESDYGENYTKELKELCKSIPIWSTVTSEDGLIEIVI